MSTENDLIISALSDQPLDSQAIADRTGLDPKQISNRLFLLKQSGAVARTVDGWILGKGEASAPAAKPRRESAPAAHPLPPTRSAAPTDLDAAMRAAFPPPARAGASAREWEFALSESGAVLYRVLAGPKQGDSGSISAIDAIALYALLHSCDFVRENA